jgi:hypothetical protein
VTSPTPPVATKQEESNTSKQKGYGISKGWGVGLNLLDAAAHRLTRTRFQTQEL